jgi:hypothetical protein
VKFEYLNPNIGGIKMDHVAYVDAKVKELEGLIAGTNWLSVENIDNVRL